MTLFGKDSEHSFYTILDGVLQPVIGDEIFYLQYSLSNEAKFHERTIYNMLDLLGDIGGLQDALCQITAFLLFFISIITKEGPHNHIMKRLFTTKGKKPANTMDFFKN